VELVGCTVVVDGAGGCVVVTFDDASSVRPATLSKMP
jgi:hypothetical protein